MIQEVLSFIAGILGSTAFVAVMVAIVVAWWTHRLTESREKKYGLCIVSI